MSTIQMYYVPLTRKHPNTVLLVGGSHRVVPEIALIKFPDESWDEVICRHVPPEIKELHEVNSDIKCLIVTHRIEGDGIHNRKDRGQTIHTRIIGLAVSNKLVSPEITTEDPPKWLQKAFMTWLIGTSDEYSDKSH